MITKQQALTANAFHQEPCTRTVGPRGGVEEHTNIWRRNGATKTWKTRPDEFRVPVKFGMYSHDYVDNTTASTVHVPEDCPLNDPDYRTN